MQDSYKKEVGMWDHDPSGWQTLWGITICKGEGEIQNFGELCSHVHEHSK